MSRMERSSLGSNSLRTRGLGRLLAIAGPVALALLVTMPAYASVTPARSWSAPYHGKFTRSDVSSTGRCAGAANDTTHSAPAFNATTGGVHFLTEANVTGSTCGAAETFARER